MTSEAVKTKRYRNDSNFLGKKTVNGMSKPWKGRRAMGKRNKYAKKETLPAVVSPINSRPRIT